MTTLDRIVEQARKAAIQTGGLISILLAVKEGKEITYSISRAQFHVEGVGWIPASRIQNELYRLEGLILNDIRQFNGKLFTGVWSNEVWRAHMDGLVENNHMIYAALAVGGLAAAVGDSVLRRRIERDKKALRRFSAALRSGRTPTVEAANNRGRTYIRSFNVTYGVLNQRAHVRAGFTEAKRLVTAAEHCRNSFAPGGIVEGCLEAAHRSWMPIREMPPIGTLTCKQFCKCYIIYR